MSQFKLHISGEKADIVAEKIAAIVEDNLQTRPTIQQVHKQERHGMRGVDPVALAALILAIPATILATMDVLERMRKKSQAEKLLEQIEQVTQKYPRISVHLEAPDGSYIDIRRENSGKLLDAANSGEQPQNRGEN